MRSIKQQRSRTAGSARAVVKALPLVLAIVFGAFLTMPCAAEDYYKMGCEAYEKNDFRQAKRCFEYVKNQQPKYWPARYQLANTFMKLGAKEDALAEYQACLEQMPDFKTAQYCKAAIAGLSKENASRQMRESLSARRDSEAKSRHEAVIEDQKQRFEANVQELRSKREQIMSEAKKQADVILSDAQKQIKDLEENGNYWVRDQTGKHLGVPYRVRNQILSEARERADRIMHDAEVRAQGIKIPEAPDWEALKESVPAARRRGYPQQGR